LPDHAPAGGLGDRLVDERSKDQGEGDDDSRFAANASGKDHDQPPF
jgi:hypothetical protein